MAWGMYERRDYYSLKALFEKSTNAMCGQCLGPDLNKLQKDICDTIRENKPQARYDNTKLLIFLV